MDDDNLVRASIQKHRSFLRRHISESTSEEIIDMWHMLEDALRFEINWNSETEGKMRHIALSLRTSSE